MKDQDAAMMVANVNTPGSVVDPATIKMEPGNLKEELIGMDGLGGIKREEDIKADPHQNGQADLIGAGHAAGPNTPLTGLPQTPNPPHQGVPPKQHNGQNVPPGPPNGDANLPHLNRGGLMDGNMPPNAPMRGGPGMPHGPNVSGPMPSMDSNFMQQQQQQSQIFVFSTTLANEGAKAVQSGHYKSILDFHIDNPRTKQFLQKHQIKLQPGGPIRTAMSMFSSNMRPDAPLMSKASQQAMMGPSPGSDSMASVAQWVQQQNAIQHVGPTFSPPPVSMQDHSTFSPPPITAPSFPGGGNNGENMPPGNWGGPQGPHPGPNASPHDMNMMGSGFNNMPGHGPASMQQSNLLSQSKIPNENLTPEQLQRREEQLAKMRKIQQMLFPEQQGGPGGMAMGGGPGPGPGGMMPMGPNGPGGPGNMHPGMMSSQPNAMTSQPNMMTSQPNMTSQPGMMGSPGSMMAMNNSPMGPGGPFIPGMPPPNWENMNPAQREWFKLQQEFYSDKRRKQAIQHMHHMPQMPPGPGPPGPGGMPSGPHCPPGPGPPPSYFNSMQRRQGPVSPNSNFNGPVHSPHMRGPSPVPGDNFIMFPGGPRRPGPGGMNFPGGGPPGPNFDPSVLDPNMPPGPGGMFPFKDEMMRGKMPTIHRAGNPEQFNPADIMPGPGTPNSSGPTKPPPSYAQAQKRKRSGDDMDDPYKKLQPAPSPQQFSYLNQFEGQELTITKQLNLAYQESADSPSNNNNNISSQQQQTNCSQQSGPPSVSQPQSVTGLNKPPGSVEALSGVNSPLPPTSSAPIPSTTSMPVSSVSSPLPTSRPSSRPSSAQAPALSQPHTPSSQQPLTPVSSSNSQRLSHYDAAPSSVPSSRGTSTSTTTTSSHIALCTTAPGSTTPTSTKNSMANITSASLANLAKGVEHLSNQMQQNMMQGGPFHNIQVQGQMADIEDSPENASGLSGSGGGLPASIGPPSSSSPLAGSSQPGPSVNNTYVNATMSIGQLNIQSVNPGGGPPGPGGYNASMQVQQMNNEQLPPQMPGLGNGPAMPNQPPMSAPCSAPCSVPCSVNCSMPGSMPPHRPPMDPFMPGVRPSAPISGPSQPMPSGVPGSFPGGPPSPGMVNSPGFRQSTGNPLGNANVQIQAKAPNTIQYLPANPPASSQPCGPGPGPVRPMKEMEMMDPACYPMEGRTSAPKIGPGGPQFGPGGEMMLGGGPGGPSGQMPMPPGPMGPSGPRMGVPQGQSQAMSMHQQSIMMQQQQQQQSGSMASQQMSSMQFNSPPGPMQPHPHRGPSPVMQEMMQMQGQHISMQQAGPMMGPGGAMRPEMMGPSPGQGPHGPGASHGPGPNQMSGYQAQYQQFQQQLYAQGRPRGPQMNPSSMGPGGPMGGPQSGGMPPGGHMLPPQQEIMGGPMGGMPPGPGMISPGPRGPGGPGPMLPMGGMGPGPGPGMGGMNMMPSMP